MSAHGAEERGSDKTTVLISDNRSEPQHDLAGRLSAIIRLVLAGHVPKPV
jgi:hypothetical protein